MATDQQGIMALPKNGQKQDTPQLGLDDSYDAIRKGLAEASPQDSMQVQQQLNQMLPALDQLTDEQLDSLINIVQYMHDHEDQYKELVAELVKKGVVDEGTFPEEYNPEVIATLGMVFLEAKRQRQASAPQGPVPPMGLAKGGIAEAARMVAGHGRNGDTMLAHINKQEAALLKAHGGSGTINPKTGLPEYWGGFIGNAISSAVGAVTGAVKSVVNGVVNTVKSVVGSPIGKVLATAALAAFIGPAAFGLSGAMGVGAQLGLASMGASVLGGGNLKDALQAGAKGFFLGAAGAAAAPTLGAATGVTSAAGQTALGAGAAGTGLGLLTGKGLQGAVKEGLTAATVAGLATGGSNMVQGKDFLTPASPLPASEVPKTPDQIKADMAQQGNLSVANQQTPPPGTVGAGQSADPLGDFIKQNEAFRTAANTPAGPAAPAPTSWTDKISEFYDKNISPSGRAQAGSDEAVQKMMDKYGLTQQQVLNAPESSVLGKQLAAATPGVLSNYGPAIAAGLGATALMGGFKTPEQPQMSPQMASTMSGQATRDLMAANPKDYLVQNLPGVQYDDKGNIIGSTPWTPRKAAQTEVGSSSYIPFTLPTYNAPTGSVGSRQVQQPYNTADMYTNLMPPRYAADGGFMQSQPTFPGTPLTMDSGPLMAQQAHPLAMNTPGVPMNMPMGLAKGGIADMAHALAAQGRNGDTILAHINPEEAAMLKAHGGSGTINPHTGLPEYWGLGNIAALVRDMVANNPDLKNAALAKEAGKGAAMPAAAPGVPVASDPTTATAQQKADYDAAMNGYQAQMRTYNAQNAANQRLKDYHARVAAQQAAPAAVDPSIAMGQQVGGTLNPSLSNADFAARLAAGARRRPAGAMAVGGIASLAPGGYPRRTGQISGPGTETSDDIPAMLSDGEFVMTAKAVKGMGGGSRRAGAKKMYALMHRLEKNAARG